MSYLEKSNVQVWMAILAPLFKSLVPLGDAAALTGTSRSSVARYYRVFRGIEDGLTDGQISLKGRIFNARTIAEIRSANEYAVGDMEATGPTAFLLAHRNRIAD